MKKCIRTYLPKNKNLTEQIRYARRKSKAKEPQNISELYLPQELTKTLDGEQFGRIIKEGTQCIILFTTYENLKILVKSNCWLMDGTFRAHSTFMKQLYTIHANIKDDDSDNNTVIPLVYVLLSSKRQNIYILLLQNLVSLAEELGISLNPEFILIDFEIAAINAIKAIFPNTKLKGCFFHLCQSIYRKIQKNGLTRRYGTDETFSSAIRHIPCLAFLETSEIPDAFNEIISLLPVECNNIIRWFDKYYANGMIQERRRNDEIVIRRPLFPPEMWSVCDINIFPLPRTQNSVESWHRRRQCLLDRNSGIFSLINTIQKEQAAVEITLEKFANGEPPKKQVKKDRLKEERIQRIMRNRQEYNIIHFIQALSHNITL